MALIITIMHSCFPQCHSKAEKYGIEALQGINAKCLYLHQEPIAERKKKKISEINLEDALAEALVSNLPFKARMGQIHLESHFKGNGL